MENKKSLHLRLMVVPALFLVGAIAWTALWHAPALQIPSQSNIPQEVATSTYTPLNDYIGKDKNFLYFNQQKAELTGPDAANIDMPSLNLVSNLFLFKDMKAVYSITSNGDNSYSVTKISGADLVKCNTNNLPACYGDIYKQLRNDLSSIAPQFIDRNQIDAHGQLILSPRLAAIQKALHLILTPQATSDRDASLESVAKRYLLIFMPAGTEFGADAVFDTQTLKYPEYIVGALQFTVGNTALYASFDNICTYTLNQPSCVPVPGTKLPNGELYQDDSGMGVYGPIRELTHTNTSFTVGVFKFVPNAQNSYPDWILQKVRDVTFPLPH